MHTQRAYSHLAEGLSRRELLHMGLAAGLTVSVLPLSCPAPLWGAEAGQPKRGGILRVRGYDPVHFDHHLTNNSKTNTTLAPVERVEVVDRYTVKFVLKEPFVWLPNRLASTSGMWIIAPEVVEKFGDLKKAESAIGTGPFILERYEPNVKTVFKRNPEYFLQGQPYVDGVECWCSTTNRPVWRCTAPGKSTAGHGIFGVCVRPTWSRCSRAIRA